ncbi:MAG: Pr6Pr family membrane protein [Clostridiales bacterium]|jgi:hypothetical protein|nr:Pr6Pr family membrane protein [Clostridiales bacterium]
MLKQNRIFSLGFRIAAFALCLAGMITGCFHDGKFSSSMLLYYTFQSNILVFIYFGAVIFKTISDIAKNGKTGNSSFPRISAAVMIAISVTMLVYWALLAPSYFTMSSADAAAFPLFGFSNLQLHLITPLLMIADYIFFTARGKLKKQDPWLFTLIPIAYLIQATIMGFSGVVYRTGPDGEITRFPYFFIDYDQSGWMVAVYVVAIAAFFVGIAYFILHLDRKRTKK